MRQTRDNAPHQNALLVRELITNKQNSLCRIGMERSYGTVCERVIMRSADGPSLSSISFVSLSSHWKVGKNERTRLIFFLRPSHIDRLDLSAGHPHQPRATVAYGQGHEVSQFPFYEYGIKSPADVARHLPNVIRMAPPAC